MCFKCCFKMLKYVASGEENNTEILFASCNLALDIFVCDFTSKRDLKDKMWFLKGGLKSYLLKYCIYFNTMCFAFCKNEINLTPLSGGEIRRKGSQSHIC